MYKIIYFVPESHKELTKNVLFELGAGAFENYDSCSFETEGMGQFRPIDSANPYIGNVGTLEVLKEYKVEMICKDALIHEAVKCLREAHPYEEVALEVYKLEDF